MKKKTLWILTMFALSLVLYTIVLSRMENSATIIFGGSEGGIVRFLLGIELEDRVEIHDLDARGGVQVLPRNRIEDLLRNAGRVRVPVGAGQAQQGAVGRDTAEIDAPGIDADGIRPDSLPAQLPEAGQQLPVQGIHVPIDPSADRKCLVRKPIDFFHGKSAAFERTQYGASGSGAAVESQESMSLRHEIFS